MPSITPAYDNKIYQKYSKKTIQNKEKNKVAFCQDYDLPYNKKVPLVCITYSLVDQNNLELIKKMMEGLLEQKVQMVITAIGSEKWQKYFTEMASKHENRFIIIPDNNENRRKIYAASNMIIVPANSDECLEESKKAMAYGVVPIMMQNDFAEDYNPVEEKGNSFIFEKESIWNVFTALVRAMENFKFPYDWKNIQANAMGGDE